jgi:hypothetical protein
VFATPDAHVTGETDTSAVGLLGECLLDPALPPRIGLARGLDERVRNRFHHRFGLRRTCLDIHQPSLDEALTPLRDIPL